MSISPGVYYAGFWTWRYIYNVLSRDDKNDIISFGKRDVDYSVTINIRDNIRL